MNSSIVYPNVSWGGSFTLGEFSTVGYLPDDKVVDDPTTTIGDLANIRSHSIIYYGNKIGQRFHTGHGVMIRELNHIGDDVSVGTGSIVEHHVKIGDRVRFHSHVFIPEFSVIEDDCWIGPHVVFTNAKYPRSRDVKSNLVGPYLEQGAKICANATILPGIRIGSGALVGSGSVVTKDVLPGDVVAGNPAKVINHVSNLPY